MTFKIKLFAEWVRSILITEQELVNRTEGILKSRGEMAFSRTWGETSEFVGTVWDANDSRCLSGPFFKKSLLQTLRGFLVCLELRTARSGAEASWAKNIWREFFLEPGAFAIRWIFQRKLWWSTIWLVSEFEDERAAVWLKSVRKCLSRESLTLVRLWKIMSELLRKLTGNLYFVKWY